MKKLFQNKFVLLLWWARSFSRFGDALETLALLYLVYDLTGSGLAMGSLMLFSALPNAIVSPFAGVVADKYNKNRIMFISELVRTISIILIPILMLTHTIHLWHVYVICVVVSIAESFFEPTAGITSLLVVGKEDLPLYNSTVTISNHFARIIGYTLSGIMIATVGKELIFAIDAFTFFTSAVVALLVKIPAVPSKAHNKSSNFKDELVGGFKYIIKNKTIMTIFLVIFLLQFLATPLETYTPLIIERILKVTKSWSGYFTAAFFIGSILGNVVYPVLNKTSIKLHHLYLWGISLFGIVMSLSVYLITPFYYLCLFLVSGAIFSLLGIWSTTEIQLQADTSYLGRVYSIFTMVTLVSSPLSGVVFGGLADIIYIPSIYKTIGLVCIIMSVLLYFSIKKAFKTANKDLQLGA